MDFHQSDKFFIKVMNFYQSNEYFIKAMLFIAVMTFYQPTTKNKFENHENKGRVKKTVGIFQFFIPSLKPNKRS